ncbi:acetate non-utilizing protein 9 [Serendipita sp. 401]|nr:acetate non-utilizing protein 9 [Serendipita sp. 401]
MRCSLLRLAQPVLIDIASVDSSVRAARATLLPPLPLYRHLLRVHRRLPLEMRSLGDDYMKSEFRRHKDTSNKVHVMGFLLEWNKYLDQLESQLTPDSKHSFRGVKMDDTMFEKVRCNTRSTFLLSIRRTDKFSVLFPSPIRCRMSNLVSYTSSCTSQKMFGSP